MLDIKSRKEVGEGEKRILANCYLESQIQNS